MVDSRLVMTVVMTGCRQVMRVGSGLVETGDDEISGPILVSGDDGR